MGRPKFLVTEKEAFQATAGRDAIKDRALSRKTFSSDCLYLSSSQNSSPMDSFQPSPVRVHGRTWLAGSLTSRWRSSGSNLNAALNVTQIAADFGMSLPTFNKYLKKTIGMTPHQYCLHSRILKACDLLTNTDPGIKEIAEATGFQNQLYFSAAFRKHCGTSPASYRENR